MLKGKKIIIGVTGSIAAFKIPSLIRLFIKEEAEVQVILTPSAKDFITPLTVSALTSKPALIDGFSHFDGVWNSHVDIGNWGDLMLVAPASANTISKMASGHADNLLIATYLAAKCPVYFAPAMDLDMYKHPSTQKNIKTLIEYGNKLISPREGILASGLSGLGRMEEPEEILKIIISDFQKKKLLKNKKSLVTAGPTCEPLDPVRYIGNHSSGLMGIEIARELYEQGSDVTLVCGPLKYEVPQGIKRIDVLTAEQMYNECCKLFPESDIFVMAAAVADYKPLSPSNNKIKKNENKEFTITLIPTPDILDSLASTKTSNQFVAGFALETDNAIENAIKKLDKKNLNLIILNSPGKDTGFGTITNKVTLITDKHKIKDIPLNTKRKIAGDIINEIISFFMNKNL